MSVAKSEHDQLIVDQFTRQAIPFANMHSVEESMQLLISAADISSGDQVLDVACGPGIVACACAPFSGHVTGIDITPAMLDQARQLQQSRNLTNMTWKLGDVTALPFSNGEFSVVLSRYAFHHFQNPSAVLGEMSRVCRPGGRIVVADVFTTNDAQDQAYNHMEKLRDPSHVRAQRLEELEQVFIKTGICAVRKDFYRFTIDLDRLLEASCTGPSEADEVRRIVGDDVGKNTLGVSAERVGSSLRFSFPIVIMAGTRAPLPAD